jgi:hypothetical protein
MTAKKKKKKPAAIPVPEFAWDRQPDESDPAWAAFNEYRSMGGMRSLAKVGQKLGKSTTLLERWSVRHSWPARSREWDIEAEKRSRDAEVNALKEMRKRQIDLAMGGQALIGIEITKHLAAARANPNTPTLSIDQCHRLGDWVTKLERQNRGEPDTIQELRHDVSVDERRKQLRQLFADDDAQEALQLLADRVTR